MSRLAAIWLELTEIYDDLANFRHSRREREQMERRAADLREERCSLIGHDYPDEFGQCPYCGEDL